MRARGLRPSVLFDQAAAPLGQDASGRYYLVRLTDDPTAARLLKRFDHPGWRAREARLQLTQQLWRLARLGRAELPGLTLEEPQTAAADGDEPAPYTCVLDAPGPRVLAERLPLPMDEAEQLFGRVLLLVWAAHQARVTGLRFEAGAIALEDNGAFRWFAPDLVPPGGAYESACREDLQHLARFGRQLVADAAALNAESIYASVLLQLNSPDATAAQALQQALSRLAYEPPLATLPAAAPLIGCDSELETLGAWLRKCTMEQRLHVLWLTGEPGALHWDVCEALATQVRPAGMRVLIARCDARHSPEVFLTGVVRQLQGLRRDGGADDRLAQIIVGDPPAELPGNLARLRLMSAFRELLQEVSAEGPVCMAWLGYEGADGLIRELVAHLRESAAGLNALLLLGFDGERAGAGPGPGADAETLHLRPLFRPEVERLARLHCPGMALGVAAIDAAWNYSQGQPARVYRLCLHWLRGNGLRQDAAGAWIPRDDGPRVSPPELEREFLRAFATLGAAATLGTMQALMDMPAAGFFELLEGALDGGWLRQEPAWLGFWQPAEAEALTEQLPPAEALRWHRRLAAVVELPAATRAYHAAHGGQDAMAAPLALQAGLRLLGRGGLEAAAAQFQLGLGVVPSDDPRRIDFVEGLATVLLERREPAQALALLVAELGRTSLLDDRAVARLATLQGRARGQLGDQVGARAAYERALPRLGGDAGPLRLRVTLALAEQALDRGERERGHSLASEALVMASALGNDVLRAEAHACAGRAALMGPRVAWPEALSALADAVALGLPVGQLEAAARAHRLAAETRRSMDLLAEARTGFEAQRELLGYLGRLDEASLAALQAASIALEMGLHQQALAEIEATGLADNEAQRPERWAQATAVRALASMYLGYLHDPLRLLDQALRTARNLEDEGLELFVLRQLVSALLFLGKHGRADEVCQMGLGIAASLGDRRAEFWLRADLAEMAWRAGDPERAGQLYQRVCDEAADVGLSTSRARAMLGLARLRHEAGELDEAAVRLREAQALITRAGHQALALESALVEGDLALARSDVATAAVAFERARELAEHVASPHHRALAQFGLGQSLGEPAQASGLLARAADQLNVYLEQLSASGRKEFLALAERRRIVDVRNAASSAPAGRPTMISLPGTRSALLELLKQGAGSSWGAWQESLGMVDEIFGLVTSRLPLEELLVRMNEKFIRISQASRGMVFLANEDGELRARDSQAIETAAVLDTGEPLVDVLERVRQTGATLWVTNALEDPDFAQLPEVQERGLRGVLCIPLKVRTPDGLGERVLGCLYGDRQAPWLGVSEKEVGLLELMARYIAVTLEIGVLQDESSRKAYRLEMLNDLSRALAGTLDLERLLNLALMQIMRVSAGQHGYLFFGEDLKCRASLDQDGKVLTEIQVSRSVIERVARERKPVTILDVGADEELQQKASLMIRNVRSVMCVPLLLDDRVVGLIYVSSSTANKTFTRNDLDLMTAIAAQIALALQNAQAYEIIKELNQNLEAKVRARTGELEQAYRELQEAQAQLLETEKLATIGTLAGGVAHEINNPLGAVLTNAQLLMADLADPEQLDSLRMIEEGARRCKEIVAALLKYSRPPQASHRPVELSDVLAETVGLFERQLVQDGIRIETRIDAEPTVMGDGTELRQVITHLLLNAIDAIHDADRPGAGRITIRLARELDGIELTVADNGVGMSAEVVKRVFDPFFTTKKVGSGTGLGLSVCQRVIDKHGGKIQVQSELGVGSTFTIALPAA